MVIFINLFGNNRSLKKSLNDNDICHYLFRCDLLEYNFKDIYRTFNMSYFSKDEDLTSNFVDSQNLKYYETIEKEYNQFISILIKKFKLRFSLMKKDDFSNEIIISEDSFVDPDLFDNSDSLVKIAIVKDNPDKWINSNLDKYDYTFVSENYYEDINKNTSCSILKGETAYEQIVYILNVLYKKRLNNFYSLLQNKGFADVFPEFKNYFKILNSEYFDEDWYRKTYDIPENTDGIIHLLLIGYKKGYNPGPNFSADEYFKCNPDISDNLNPLVHYETYGRKENRCVHASEIYPRDYSLIANSSYFDEDWYKRTYDINDEDCVDHYLKTGYLKWYDPGPDFSTFQYLECNRDIKKIKLNPLVHYEMIGRKEKRKLFMNDEIYQMHRSAISDSPYFEEDWYKHTYDIQDMNSIDHYWKIGFARGYDPGPDFSTDEYYECNPDVKEYGLNPLVHYEQFGRKEKRKLRVSDKD